MHLRTKPLAYLLAIMALSSSITPAFAAEATIPGGQSSVDAILNAEASTFSVSVPTSLPVWVDSSGAVTVSTSAKIVNNSSGPVQVSGVEVIGKNTWSLASFDADLTTKKVGTKEVGFYLNGDTTDQQGLNFNQSNWAEISGGSEQALDYNANIAPQSEALKEQIAEVVFTIGWSLSEQGSPDESGVNATYEVDKDKMSEALQGLTGTITFKNSVVVPDDYDTSVDVSDSGDGSVMAYISGQDAIIQADGGVLAPQDSSVMFVGYGATSLDLSGMDTSKAQTMMYMISSCENLKTLDISNFNTSNTTNMSYMFDGCTSLTDLDLSSFDTSKVDKMQSMFYDCNSLVSLNISSFNTYNVTDMSSMFYNNSSLIDIDVSKFNTSSVNNMYGMFMDCSGIESLDLGNFDIINNSDIRNILSGCTSLATVYTKTQADADKLNTTSGNPAGLQVIVKS